MEASETQHVVFATDTGFHMGAESRKVQHQ